MEVEAMEGCCLAPHGFFPMGCSACSLILSGSQNNLLRIGTTHNKLGSPMSIINKKKKNALQATPIEVFSELLLKFLLST